MQDDAGAGPAAGHLPAPSRAPDGAAPRGQDSSPPLPWAPPRDASWLGRPVRELVRRPPVTCPPELTIAEAARRMQAYGVGSVVVVDGDGRPVGIVTDRDLRAKVVAGGVPSGEAVARIMSAPLETVSPETPAIEALLTMLRLNIHHLPVVDAPARTAAGGGGSAPGRGRLVGVVSSNDFVGVRDVRPLHLLREIEQAQSLAELHGRVGQLNEVVRHLVEGGAWAVDVARITAELHDGVVRRVLKLTEHELASEGFGEPPGPYCWLALGSEGRREQTLKTDQDNALVYEKLPGLPEWGLERYFRELAGRAVQGLIRLGFPPCPAQIMASNPTWCQPLDVWKGYFSRWVRQSSTRDLLMASIFFDFRPVWGDPGLAGALHAHLRAEVEAWRAFLRLMAWTAVYTGPPLGAFGRIVAPRFGPHRGSVDLKLQGMLPLVSGVRVYALELGLPVTNTVERVQQAAEAGGRFQRAEAEELVAAYEVLTRLRLRQQLADLQAGRQPDSRVVVRALNRADRAALREAFLTIQRLQDGLRSRYLTEALYG